MKRVALILLIAAISSGQIPYYSKIEHLPHCLYIGENVSYAGSNGPQAITEAIRACDDGIVTVQVGAELPGLGVKVKSVKVVK